MGVSCSPWEEPWELVAATKNGRLLSMSFCWPGQGWMKHDRRVSLAYGGERDHPVSSTWSVYLAGIERSKQEEQVWVKTLEGLEASNVDADVSLALLTNTLGIPNFVPRRGLNNNLFPSLLAGCCLSLSFGSAGDEWCDVVVIFQCRCCDLHALIPLKIWYIDDDALRFCNGYVIRFVDLYF